jgi:hypothetical protein
VAFTQVRARRAGLQPPTWRSYIFFANRGAVSATNYPTPRSAGPIEWIKDQFAKLSNRRTARGAYEETGSGADGYSAGGAPARRGRGLEDDAWDTRVGNEDPYGHGPGGYYEEQELGLEPMPGLHSEPYAGYAGEERGRSKSREGAGSQSLDPNPFGDQHEAASLRSVSPMKGTGNLDAQQGNTSPTSRRSMFREGL